MIDNWHLGAPRRFRVPESDTTKNLLLMPLKHLRKFLETTFQLP